MKLTNVNESTVKKLSKKKSLFARSLSPEETANPRLVIKSFFFNYGLNDSRNYISKWMNAIYTDAGWIKKRPADVLIFSDVLFDLIDASWLICQEDNSKRLANLTFRHSIESSDLMNPDFYSRAKTKDFLWANFPRSLNKKDYLNPYRVFSKFFKIHSLDDWKDELRHLLILALSDGYIEDIDTLTYQNLLFNLIDACHLIHERE